MNRQQRYEPVPQREEPIILSSISNNPSYNYNTALPTSVAGSSHGGAPSVISVPNSPPPSFHTHSSPGTPRPSHAQMQQHGGSYAELWGVAASTVGGETIDTSNDALATIKGLKQRVEWLEESIGRMILEREAEKRNPTHNEDPDIERNNCCVSFSDASPELENTFMRNRHNCCVSFSGRKSDAKLKEQKLMLAAAIFVIMMVCATVAVVMTAKSGRVNRAVNQAVDKAVEMME